MITNFVPGVCNALDRAAAPMHHYVGTMTDPFGEGHSADCPGCEVQTLSEALKQTLIAFYEADGPACAVACDTIDPRGALLGRVRVWVQTAKEEA